MEVEGNNDFRLETLQSLTLCDACEGLVSDIRARQRGSEPTALASRIYQAYALIASSKNCLLCHTILYGSNPKLVEDLQREERQTDCEVSANISLEGEIAIVDFEGWPDTWRTHNAGSSIVVCIPTSGRYRSRTAARAIWTSKKLDLDSRVNTPKEWLGECLSSHSKCKAQTMAIEYPTRLLDLGPSGAINDPIKLVHKKTLVDNQQQYATLSHCWGPSEQTRPWKTTRANQILHEDGISTQSLPKTFRDAMKFAKAMSVRYLWVDALCIIQDDKEDWEREASQMASYYNNGIFTIAATSAVDSTGGCFLEWTNENLHFGVSRGASNSDFEVKIRSTRADLNEVLNSPLNKRGWTLQEMVLSTRIIHMAKDQWYWQCCQRFESEDGTVVEDPDFLFAFGDRDPDRAHRLPPGYNRMTKQWHSLAEEYSGRSLTFDTDTLPAVAGMVSFFQERMRDNPILGMWKSSLAYDLHWVFRRSQPFDPAMLFKSLRLSLPSWSWLSASEPIFYIADTPALLDGQARSLRNRLDIAEYDIQWSGFPYASRIFSIHLVVSGFLHPLREIQYVVEGEDHSHLSLMYDRIMALDEKTVDGVVLLLLYDTISTLGDIATEAFLALVPVPLGDQPTSFRRVGAGFLRMPRSRFPQLGRGYSQTIYLV
ncbi:heterokaryon incompatibility protein-domain-containing protein [Lasiosphaeria hispida]|uniref:Heterokaryon incompatibility protein-domain-containing protein n=1 Tax=Lasiosphaeria hispida TaxID=260671 RepID=A0AAJ0HN49_9PEZI|nr:heterokaryon incompatibility protein-domain-containing protein [Lasiosphaeria hispida]